MSVNFEYYKVFYYVAEYLNITRAAERLCLTQPSVTKSIKNLETQLDCRLFERNRRGVKLTPEGHALFGRIQPACRAIFDAEEDLAQRKAMQSGIVRICTGISALQPFLLSVIQTYRETYPSISVDVQDNRSGIPISSLESGKFDMLLDLAPVDMLPAGTTEAGPRDRHLLDNVHIELLRSVYDVPIVGRDFAYLTDRDLTLCSLLDYPIILRKIDTLPQGFYYNLLKQKMSCPDASYLAVDSMMMRAVMTQANLGVSFIPVECVQDKIASGAILPLHVPERLLERRFVLITPKNHQLSPAARHFADMLTRAVRERL